MFRFSIYIFWLFFIIPFPSHCQPTIGFLDAFEDETLAKARKGFFDALAKNGYSEKDNSLKVIYRNAQGDIPLLTQACDYMIAQDVVFIATCPTLSTITAIQRSKSMPVCMMVSPSATLAGISDTQGNPPPNLFGVYETLEYIDTALSIIPMLKPNTKTIGLLYNQSEPQSMSALEHIKRTCTRLHITLVALPANNSSETQLIVQALIRRKIDAFFALPDNTVFASFEVIAKECKQAHIPIFTSESGLFDRGADAAFGADMYQWGYQAGIQASEYLLSKQLPAPQLVTHRKKFIRNITPIGKTKDEKPTSFYVSALILALTFTALCLGLFVSMNVFKLPDITTDGSYTLGACVTAVLLMHHFPIYLTGICVLLVGACAGMITAFIHTKLNVNTLLSGIITMTALYSVNLFIMGKSNVPLYEVRTLFSDVSQPLIIPLLISIVIVLALYWLLRTDYGIAMRATGTNEQMVTAFGVDTHKIKIVGLAISNSLVAFSGFMVAQYQGFADINMGIGIVIFGLGSVLIGNTLYDLLQFNHLLIKLCCVVLGAILFRFILALSLSLGFDPVMLKLITSLFVLSIVAIPKIFPNLSKN